MRNTLREKLENGEILLGAQSFLGSKEAMEILGALGYDFVFICAEHPAVGTERMFDLVKYCEWAGTPALVRLPIYDPTYTKKVLDGGVSGVLFPMIKDVSDAEKAMDLCLYPPNGKRGFGPMSAVRWGLDDETAFVQKNVEGTVRMIQIEHIGAVECIDKLAENPWIDAFIFGPNDLAASMGISMICITLLCKKQYARRLKYCLCIIKDSVFLWRVRTPKKSRSGKIWE